MLASLPNFWPDLNCCNTPSFVTFLHVLQFKVHSWDFSRQKEGYEEWDFPIYGELFWILDRFVRIEIHAPISILSLRQTVQSIIDRKKNHTPTNCIVRTSTDSIRKNMSTPNATDLKQCHGSRVPRTWDLFAGSKSQSKQSKELACARPFLRALGPS